MDMACKSVAAPSPAQLTLLSRSAAPGICCNAHSGSSSLPCVLFSITIMTQERPELICSGGTNGWMPNRMMNSTCRGKDEGERLIKSACHA